MHPSPISPRTKIQTRIAALLVASLISVSASAPAADALTNVASNAVGKNLLGALFKKRSRIVDASPDARASAMERVNRSILGLPFMLARGLGKGMSRAAKASIADHIQHY